MRTTKEWTTVTLGDICNLPQRWKKKDTKSYSYIDIASIDSQTKKITATQQISSASAPSRATTHLVPGDVLVSTVRPNRNAVAMVPPDQTDAIASSGLAVLRPTKHKVDSRYLFHAVQTKYFIQQCCDLATGASYPAISDSKIRSIAIPLPPLAEQRRIADILDASAETIQKTEHFQRSLLPLVVNTIEKKVASSDGTLGNLIGSISSGKNVAESRDPNQKNRVLKVSAVTSGTFKSEESKPLPEMYLPPKDHQVRSGDILVSRANTTQLLGASALVQNEVENLYLPDKLWRVIPQDGVDPYLLWGILQTRTVRARISQRATGSSGSMKNISQKNFLLVPCATFSRSESAKLAALIREAVRIDHQIEQKLVLLRSFHHSLSTRAFAGQL